MSHDDTEERLSGTVAASPTQGSRVSHAGEPPATLSTIKSVAFTGRVRSMTKAGRISRQLREECYLSHRADRKGPFLATDLPVGQRRTNLVKLPRQKYFCLSECRTRSMVNPSRLGHEGRMRYRHET